MVSTFLEWIGIIGGALFVVCTLIHGLRKDQALEEAGVAEYNSWKSVFNCWNCYECLEEKIDVHSGLPVAWTRMIGCSLCGNKRCPHGTDHRLACTNSNETGQLGSRYE